MLYDTHCHLNLAKTEEIVEIVNRAKQSDVKYIMQAGTKIDDIASEVDICNKFSDKDIKIFCAIADHPEEVRNNVHSTEEICSLVKMSDKIKSIGETGLDTHVAENLDFLEKQIASFENHIEASIKLNLPLIIHMRGNVAVMKIIEILKFYQKDGIKAVMHSYSDNAENAKKILDIGCYISFSGIVTFKNAYNVREAAKMVPIDRMFIETDAPFLAPEPMRGKTNETSFVKHTSKYLSDFLKIDYKKFSDYTTENAKKFFNHD